ncbi:MAG: succinylglutamate desuccinylase/aspartoacylase family protein [Isosphaeraceae bacterium]
MSGTSWFESIRIAGTTEGPHVVITAGVHGDEFEPMAAVRDLGRRLTGNLHRGAVTLVPVVNEPAFRLGQRTAEDGLDLARVCPGRQDGSVTERIAHDLARLIRSADAYIDLHTGGVRLTVLPLVGYMLHPNPEVLSIQRRMARAFGLDVIWGTSPDLNGRSLSVARDAAVPAIYAEYLGGGRFEPRAVEAYVRGCEQVLGELGVVEPRDSGIGEPRLVIEDGSPGSGHMQVQHPSPEDGFFQADVEPGIRVETGQLLGRLSDPTGRRVMPIVSERAGWVFVVRTFASVRRGDGLAVVVSD